LIRALAAQETFTATQAELVVNCVFETVTGALKRSNGVEIREFGSFTMRHYKPYKCRNPRSGTVVDVAPKRLAHFKVGKECNELVAGKGESEAEGRAQ
jgi:integration host factor subunit beta